MEKEPWIAVSADGVVSVKPPGQENVVHASLEIKTKVAEKTIASAKKVRELYEDLYFRCVVGDEVWFKSVPWAHRGQLFSRPWC